MQRLLAVLASARRVAEIGTAFGEGAAAMATSAREVVTVELDAARVGEARRRLAGFPNVELLQGDWRELLPPRAPFDLVFADGGGAKQPENLDLLIELAGPCGLLVCDDLTPGLPGPDPVREAWLGNPRLAAVEILTTRQTAAIVAGRLP